MLPVARRLEFVVVCLAVACSGLVAGVRGRDHVSASRGTAALALERPVGVPVALGTGRISLERFASERKSPSHEVQFAIARTHGIAVAAGHWTRVPCRSTLAAAFLAACARAERGPPRHILS